MGNSGCDDAEECPTLAITPSYGRGEPIHPDEIAELSPASLDRGGSAEGGRSTSSSIARRAATTISTSPSSGTTSSRSSTTFAPGTCHYATPTHELEPWDGRRLDLPIHGIWARRSAEPSAPWTCEFLLNEERDDESIFLRNEAIGRPLEEIGDERNGVPFLRPEIVLLYKSSERSPKNDTDFAAVVPRLSREARLWLRAALERYDSRHPWVDALG